MFDRLWPPLLNILSQHQTEYNLVFPQDFKNKMVQHFCLIYVYIFVKHDSRQIIKLPQHS